MAGGCGASHINYGVVLSQFVDVMEGNKTKPWFSLLVLEELWELHIFVHSVFLHTFCLRLGTNTEVINCSEMHMLSCSRRCFCAFCSAHQLQTLPGLVVGGTEPSLETLLGHEIFHLLKTVSVSALPSFGSCVSGADLPAPLAKLCLLSISGTWFSASWTFCWSSWF